MPKQKPKKRKAKASDDAPKWKYGEGGWNRLREPGELQRLVDSDGNQKRGKVGVLEAIGLAYGGANMQKLKAIAKELGVELRTGQPGPKRMFPATSEPLKEGDAEALGLPPDEQALLAEHRHQKRLEDTEVRQVDVLQRELQRLYKVIEKHQTEQELVLDAIERTVMARKPVPVEVPGPRKYTTDDHLLMPCISDVHIGELILHEETGGLGQYDWPTFLRRYEAYKDGFSVILNDILRKAMPIRNAVVAVHGDIGTNEDIYAGQAFHIDLLALDQLFSGADYLSALLLFIASQCERVDVHFVPGNHGRLRNSSLNLDVVMYKIISRTVAAQPNLNVYNSTTHYAAWRVDKNSGHVAYPEGCDQAHDFFLIHGDAVKQYLDQPAYGMCRSVQRYAAMCGVPFTYGIYGHFHQLGRFGHGRVWCNGAWPGGGQYSVKQFQSAAEPAQSMFVVHPKYGIVMDYPIRFGEACARLTLDKNSVYTPYDAVDETVETEAA